MPTDRSEPETPEQPRRPWWRLHLSTWVVVLLTAAVLVLIIVPGEKTILAFSSGPWDKVQYSHGWPWAWLEQIEWERTTLYNGEPPEPLWRFMPWLSDDAWKFTGDEVQFRFSMFAFDPAIAAAIVVIAAAFEVWRRRRYRLWQFSLRELFVLTLVVAVVLGWWQGHRRRRLHELEALSQINRMVPSESAPIRFRHLGPVWLRKLLGTPLTADFVAFGRLMLSGRWCLAFSATTGRGFVCDDFRFQPGINCPSVVS